MTTSQGNGPATVMKAKKNIITAAVAIAAAVAMIDGMRGEYAESVIQEMTQEQYEQVRNSLGDEATDYRIAKEFQKNPSRYGGKGRP